MTPRHLDVFSLPDSVVDEYRRFATSFTTIHAQDIRRQIEAIYAEGRFRPDPLIQINPSYKAGVPFAALTAGGGILLGRTKHPEEREFYLLAAIKSGWSSRESKRQTETGAAPLRQPCQSTVRRPALPPSNETGA